MLNIILISMKNIYNYHINDLTNFLYQFGQPSYRAAQIFNWLYKSKSNSFNKMKNIPNQLKEILNQNFSTSLPTIIEAKKSLDASIKYLLLLNDNNCIETVFIPGIKRDTICLSTQVGCPFDCKFCITAQVGFKRNLTTDEIIGQLLLALPNYNKRKKINIVFMGMGEPLLNIKNIMKSISIMTNKNGLGLSLRNITLSTIGYPNGLIELSKYKKIPKIALSLHSLNKKTRNFLMPKASKFSLKKIISSLKLLPTRKGNKITLEYIMINGINDSLKDADKIIKLTKKLSAKVNLIPLNEAPQLQFKSTPMEKIENFANYLKKNNITATIRKSRGKDISAACGMLSGSILKDFNGA